MHISFSDPTLRMICENEEFAQDQLGSVFAKKLKTRLADIMAANCVMDIPTGSPKEVVLEGRPAYQIEILPSHFLIFLSVHQHQPLNKEDQLDWNKVNRIKIVKIQ
ncbi:hypothetical protein [Mucilaginibacter sp. KACC 22063]|uniref:hypothetical protein n=1 Tax=Mucilaginibacter sp. KACC 22063 TaxID=3025666 RepID=UPI002365E59F|nr:hypothetical protein [Mucilaginibacter sp. KACC 22063]WDF55245.1 hypothetical protein PQ461_20135 [Mucilaginibacter sp. KACC 22063]